jgi:hypothetical protein
MFITYLRRELAGRRKEPRLSRSAWRSPSRSSSSSIPSRAACNSPRASVLASVYGVGTDITVKPDAGRARRRRRRAAAIRLRRGRGRQRRDSDGRAARASTRRGQHLRRGDPRHGRFGRQRFGRCRDPLPDQRPSTAPCPTGRSGPPTTAAPPEAGRIARAEAPSTLTRSRCWASTRRHRRGAAVGDDAADGRTLSGTDAGSERRARFRLRDNLDSRSATRQVPGPTSPSSVSSLGSSESATAANAYIPLDVAQALSGLTGQVSDVYVQAASSTDIAGAGRHRAAPRRP